MKDLSEAIKKINRRIGQKIGVGEREVAKRYANTLLEIRRLTANLYEKYERDGKLTWADLQKYDRWNKYKEEFYFLLRTHYKDLNKEIPSLIGDIYEDGYYLTAHAVETAALAKLSYSAITPETMTKMVQNPVTGLTLSETLERNRVNIVYTIQQEVTRGLVRGETYGQMSKRLTKVLKDDTNKAVRIVRTEGHRVQEGSKHDAMEHAQKKGIKSVKTWNTLEDNRVRVPKKSNKANHKKLNNVTIEVDKDFSDGLGSGPSPGNLGAAGSDINCRCFLTYEVKEIGTWDREDAEKTTFEDWKKELTK